MNNNLDKKSNLPAVLADPQRSGIAHLDAAELAPESPLPFFPLPIAPALPAAVVGAVVGGISPREADESAEVVAEATLEAVVAKPREARSGKVLGEFQIPPQEEEGSTEG